MPEREAGGTKDMKGECYSVFNWGEAGSSIQKEEGGGKVPLRMFDKAMRNHVLYLLKVIHIHISVCVHIYIYSLNKVITKRVSYPILNNKSDQAKFIRPGLIWQSNSWVMGVRWEGGHVAGLGLGLKYLLSISSGLEYLRQSYHLNNYTWADSAPAQEPETI